MTGNQLTAEQIRTIQFLLDRLERISADSRWAHRASGLRAALAKSLSLKKTDSIRVEKWIEVAFEILENAALEIPE
jgi:hypothetical protein